MDAAQTTSEPVSFPKGRPLDARRIYPALVFIPFFYALVRYGPPIAFFALVAAASLCALAELYRLHFRGVRAPLEVGIGLTLMLIVLAGLQWPGVLSMRTIGLTTLIAVLTSRLMTPRDIEHGLADSAVLVFGVFYIGLTLGSLLSTRLLPDGEWLIFFLFLVTWAGDTGAYYEGSTLGRHKLAPIVSPNKTIEGAIGGLLLAVLVAGLARVWFLPSFSLTDCLAAATLLTAAGIVGDLTESVLKRSAGVKDSGGLIPAHGGMLDRLDSLLFAAPAFYFYVTLVKG
ncbi:MAG: phosphatidate cytidylyltransferase [Nitrospiraceae bacterium]